MDHLNIFAQSLISCSFNKVQQILEMKEIPAPQVNLGSSVGPVVSTSIIC